MATVIVAVGSVAWIVSSSLRRAFESVDAERTDALVNQFQREFERSGEDVRQRLQALARSASLQHLAADLNQPELDPFVHFDAARDFAEAQRLDFLELVTGDGTIISSAQWPARAGSKEDLIVQKVDAQETDWLNQGVFLRREETPEGAALAMEGIAQISSAQADVYLLGGRRLDRDFLASLLLPHDMRALLYSNLDPSWNPQSLVEATGAVANAELLRPLIERTRAQAEESSAAVYWSSNAEDSEVFQAFPLTVPSSLSQNGRPELLGVLLVGSSRRKLVKLERRVRQVAMQMGAFGALFSAIVGLWVSARVTRPVDRLAAAASKVAGGDWTARVEAHSSDEIGQLAQSFNYMTAQLTEQRERLIQSERVAAWRELARRLAHELKNPLFPLQITIENLVRARAQHMAAVRQAGAEPQGEFEEVFRETTATLLAEVTNLKTVIGRFSDFAKMPAPQLRPLDLNESVRQAVRLFEAAGNTGCAGLGTSGSPVTPVLDLDDKVGTIQADPDLLHRVVQNLVLNALDAMPEGGTLTLRTRRVDGSQPGVRLEVSDTGTGLTPEECERLFTPYYTTKQRGTGLGLAIVQSVVSDHGGKISVESEPGRGTTFCIDLPSQGAQGSTKS
jgi:signal transduction histidine kinase